MKKPDILLVEDDSINAFVILKFLSEMYAVTHAATGQEALEEAEQKDYQLILMDINLGDEDFDGVEALRRIRQLPTRNQIPIMAVTAYAMNGDRERFLQAGFDSYLAKPVKKESLIVEMERLLHA